MSFEEEKNPEGWNEEVLRLGGGFLHSWEWGDFQEKNGREVLRLREVSGALLQAIRMPLPLGKSYWYCPRGPVFEKEGEEVIDAISGNESLRDGLFFRFDPIKKITSDEIKKVSAVQPGQTSILDLSRSPDEIMADMHEKTRYNIRLAERKGVKVFPAPKSNDGFETFWQLLKETTERGRFKGHGKEYYRNMLDVMNARILFAEHDGKVLAAILLISFGGRVTYLHGASNRERRELMAPYLLHWQAILDAKEQGYKEYDFWGVAPEGAKDHPWAGITRFKKGFGGKYVEYPGTYDLPLNKFWYGLYSTVQKLRRRH